MAFLGSDPSPTPSPQFAGDEVAHRRHMSTGVVRYKCSSSWLSGVLAIVQEQKTLPTLLASAGFSTEESRSPAHFLPGFFGLFSFVLGTACL